MFNIFNCSISLINRDNLVIFKFPKSKFNLKENNKKSSKVDRFLNSYDLKWYEARGLKKSFRGQILYRRLDPSKKTASRSISIIFQKNYIL